MIVPLGIVKLDYCIVFLSRFLVASQYVHSTPSVFADRKSLLLKFIDHFSSTSFSNKHLYIQNKDITGE